jgi:GAF domain-containing protein
MSGTVLCVDPDDEARSATASTLEDAGLTVTTCPDLATAVDRLDGTIDCVVSEFELPDGSGLDLLTVLRERVPDASFVLFTEADPDDIDSSAPDGAVIEYVPKRDPGARTRLAELVHHSVAFRTQTAYPLPDDERDRVEALEAYRPILSDVAPAFDRLATLASDLLDVPMAAIGILDEHEQEFVACYGVDFGVFPREETVCTYALLESGVSTIPDLADDPRFADNEGLDTLDLRAYASANLTTSEGRVVGTFCAYDSGPREWTDQDREHLQLLAAEAMEQMDLRRRLHEHGDTGDATDRRPDAVPAGNAADRRRDPDRPGTDGGRGGGEK